MTDIKIVPYTEKDNEAGLALEDQCTQGKSLVLKFKRPTFHARSQVYDNYKILCAKSGSKLIGIIAGTRKTVQLHGEKIHAVYVYDLRVHPDFRRKGIGKQLLNALLEEIGQLDCIYMLIAGGNEQALALATRNFEAKVIAPLTYLVIPVYKELEEKEEYRFKTASEVHELFMKKNPDLEFVPKFDKQKLHGLVSSITLNKSEKSGCSIWTNENLLAEQVVRIPLLLKLIKMFAAPLRPIIKVPAIPQSKEIIQSWFLFDFYGKDRESVRNLLAVVNNLALVNDRTCLYILLQAGNPMIQFVKAADLRIFKFPYVFFAKGAKIPDEKDYLYVDVRDL
jgi:ribosomal protein S18 acetylase RimI-like enzyme